MVDSSSETELVASRSRALNLLKDPIPELLRKTSIPAITGMIFGTLYNIVDTLFAGLHSTSALAAFTMSFPIYFIVLLSVSVGYSNGLKTVIAHAIGQGKNNEASCLLLQGIFLGLCVGLPINITAYLSLDWFISFLETTPENIAHAKDYMSVIFLGGIVLNFMYAVFAPLGAIGDTRTVRNGEIFGSVCNVALNPILMFGWFGLPALGLAGLGLSTVLIWSAIALYALWRLIHSSAWKNLCWDSARPRPRLWRKIFLQSLPSIINMLRIGILFTVFAIVMSRFGTEVLAGYGAGFRIEGLIILPVIGLNAAAVAIVAQNYGAKNIARVQEIYRLTLIIGLSMMVAGAVLIYLAADLLVLPFTDDAITQGHAAQYLRIGAWGLPTIAIINLVMCIMQGMQRTFFSVTILIVTQAILPAILLPYIAEHYSHIEVWFAMVCILWLSAIFMFITVRIVMRNWQRELARNTT